LDEVKGYRRPPNLPNHIVMKSMVKGKDESSSHPELDRSWNKLSLRALPI
jgi:hypothetical protein